MTKVATNITIKYQDYYKAWLMAHYEKAGYEKEMKLLTCVDLLENVLVNDCNLGYKKLAEIRNKAFDEYYAGLAK